MNEFYIILNKWNINTIFIELIKRNQDMYIYMCVHTRLLINGSSVLEINPANPLNKIIFNISFYIIFIFNHDF